MTIHIKDLVFLSRFPVADEDDYRAWEKRDVTDSQLRRLVMSMEILRRIYHRAGDNHHVSCKVAADELKEMKRIARNRGWENLP